MRYTADKVRCSRATTMTEIRPTVFVITARIRHQLDFFTDTPEWRKIEMFSQRLWERA